MGQRHQAFLIARVVPHGTTQPCYRCIAAIHHQWCYGSLPLRAIRRFLDLVKVPQNAYILAEELKTLNGKYGLRSDYPPKMPGLPCQYASLLLANAFSVDLDEPHAYSSAVILLPATMGCFDGDYEDGITIFDITDPLHPAYVLVTLDGSPYQATCESALSYIRHYYPAKDAQGDNEQETMMQGVVDRLKGERRIALDALQEAWPKEFPPTVKIISDEAGHEPVSDDLHDALEFPTLVDLTLKGALQQALQDGSVMALEHFAQSVSTAKRMKEYLRQESPLTFGAAHLMSLIVEGEAHSPDSAVDLSNFPICTTENFLAMLSPSVHSIDTLNISHNIKVTIDTLRLILEQIPKIRRLVLLDTGITNEDLGSLLASHPQLFFHVESLVHPLCLTEPNMNDFSSRQFVSQYPSQFTFLSTCEGWYSDSGTPAAFYLPTFTPPKIVQFLIDFLEPLERDIVLSRSATVKGILGSEYRKGERFGKRSIGMIPTKQSPYDERTVQADGWVFTIWYNLQMGRRPGLPSFGFFRGQPITQPQSEEESSQRFTYEAHTLNSFLASCEKEGRPPAAPADVARLQKVINCLMGVGVEQEDNAANRPPKTTWSQMTLEIFALMLKGVAGGGFSIPWDV